MNRKLENKEDLAWLAREYSRQIAPESPIHDVEERDIPGCMGALVYSDSLPRQWGIYYQNGQSPGRRAFTIGHELGHYLLHRELIETDSRFEGGISGPMLPRALPQTSPTKFTIASKNAANC